MVSVIAAAVSIICLKHWAGAAAGCWVSNVLLVNENIWIDILVKILVFSLVSGLMILIRDPEQRKRVDELIGLLMNKKNQSDVFLKLMTTLMLEHSPR